MIGKSSWLGAWWKPTVYHNTMSLFSISLFLKLHVATTHCTCWMPPVFENNHHLIKEDLTAPGINRYPTKFPTLVFLFGFTTNSSVAPEPSWTLASASVLAVSGLTFQQLLLGELFPVSRAVSRVVFMKELASPSTSKSRLKTRKWSWCVPIVFSASIVP